MSKGVKLREESRMIKGDLIFVSLELGRNSEKSSPQKVCPSAGDETRSWV